MRRVLWVSPCWRSSPAARQPPAPRACRRRSRSFSTSSGSRCKPGRAADHAKWEAGWPAAFEKAKSPYNYIALQSITGPTEVLYVSPLANQAAYGEMMAEVEKQAPRCLRRQSAWGGATASS